MPIIKAKYAGRCYSCGDQYEIGDEVWWSKGDAPLCVGCHEEDTANAASPIKPVQQGVTARFKTEARKQLDYDETVLAIRESADTQIPALLAICVEEAIKRGVFREGGMERFIAKVRAKTEAAQ
jgi:hypothetical protein